MSRVRIFSCLSSRSVPPSVRAYQANPFFSKPYSSPHFRRYQHQYRESYGARLRRSWRNTRVEWYSIPVAAGIGFLAARQFYKTTRREKARIEEEEALRSGAYDQDGEDNLNRPKRRKRIRPSGPWQVQVMSTLPLKAMSRLWGKFNELDIPYYLRVPGFLLYSAIFRVDLSEIEETDLHNFPNLAAFFYRSLRPGVRPLDPNPNSILSPADGTIIQFGTIENGEVEQVKGMTYSLEALLGSHAPSPSSSGSSTPTTPGTPSSTSLADGDEESIRAHEEFAQMNGITYTLPSFLGSGSGNDDKNTGPTTATATDQSTAAKPLSEAVVRDTLALSRPSWWTAASAGSAHKTALYYCVFYLAPGDYHRLHSPAAWVVERRRHFAGELYSVAPFLQRTLPGLFTLNERVVLLGRWRWGFFSCTPVGATNVGSIVVNFDRELRTNNLLTDTAADRAADRAARRGEQWAGFAEATYENASPLLHGHPLRRGEEFGGFQLGSTVVLVFEAPRGKRTTSFDEGYSERERLGWRWRIEKGQRIKFGEAIGEVLEE